MTLDADTTVHALFGHQMGVRKNYHPKNKGRKSDQPILTLLSETPEYISGELRNGDRPTGVQIARHLESVFAALPPAVKRIYARADTGFYCGEAVEAYQSRGVQFIISARQMSCLVEELKAAVWRGSRRTDVDGQCEFHYQPEGWGKAHRFLALRYQKRLPPSVAEEPEQYQLFDTPEFRHRVFVTYMLAYNLNCGLMLFNREEDARVATLQHIYVGDGPLAAPVPRRQNLAARWTGGDWSVSAHIRFWDNRTPAAVYGKH